MWGRLEKLTVHSELLEGNPLGDPADRPLYVYLPEGIEDDKSYATIYVIQGLLGQLDTWLSHSPFEPNIIERLEDLFSDSSVPRAIVVFVDAWTSIGGSQFLNSAATGRYMDYLCDEIVPFVDERYPTKADARSRGLTGKSSGGYGAMVVPMKRPDVFNALATNSGDALFEVCYLPDIRDTVRLLRDKFDSSYDVFWSKVRRAPKFDFDDFGQPLNIYCMAAAYSPDEEEPGLVALPFDIETGRMNDAVWERWLAWDPVRMVPTHADALRQMRLIYIDAGTKDEWFLDLGAKAFTKELDDAGLTYEIDFFDDGHGGIQYRYPRAIKRLAEVLSD
jgi:S-formylglutathione hydrolase FrmB